MARKNNNHLFFTCSLIEYIGRKVKRTRKQVVDFLGEERIERIYEYADVFHCELLGEKLKKLSEIAREVQSRK